MKKAVVFLILLASCSSIKRNTRNIEKWNPLLGEKITVTGKAYNMKLGVKVFIEKDCTSLWLDGIRRWPYEYYSE